MGYYDNYAKNERSRKSEIINKCLQTFMKRGLAHTSTKDLCDALRMNSGAVFYYFKNKDEMIIACAEEASLRIERDLISVAVDEVDNPPKMFAELQAHSDAMRPLMKFFVSVCATPKYEEALQPALERLTKRYNQYAEQFAKALCATQDEVTPYLYVGINTMLSYMLFGQKTFYAPQLSVIEKAMDDFLERKNAK